MNTRSPYRYTITLLCVVLCSVILIACTAMTSKLESADANAPSTSVISYQLEYESPSHFYEHTMNAAPFLPNNQNTKSLNCALPQANKITHTSSNNADYANYGWEQRIAHDWSFFEASAKEGRILIIDIKEQNGATAYRYLANDNTQNDLYEPWSSSKIFAFTGAIAKLRSDHAKVKNSLKSNIDELKVAQGLIGEHHIADMITSINSYEAFNKADGNSNAMATFFANLATRTFLTALFYDEWLKLSTPNIFFKGAYGPSAFTPSEYIWRSAATHHKIEFEINNIADQDPAYLPYRCSECGINGNKPMTTLAQAEWLKRLAMHNDDPQTAHPYLTQSDMNTLFYGEGHSQSSEQFAGMTLGISTMLQQAIAKHIGSSDNIGPQLAKRLLDDATQGEWRVFQKIGWGPSETRSTSENVVLAHVCLPYYKGGRSFVVAAQVAVPGAVEENVALAGIKMQALLDKSVSEYLSVY